MFICNECGEVFEEPKVFEETHGLDTPPYEKWYLCPHCGDTGISRALECTRCGEWISEHHAMLGDGLQPLCETCYEDMHYE